MWLALASLENATSCPTPSLYRVLTLCLQESKLHTIDLNKSRAFLPGFLSSFYVPTDGSTGNCHGLGLELCLTVLFTSTSSSYNFTVTTRRHLCPGRPPGYSLFLDGATGHCPADHRDKFNSVIDSLSLNQLPLLDRLGAFTPGPTDH